MLYEQIVFRQIFLRTFFVFFFFSIPNRFSERIVSTVHNRIQRNFIEILYDKLYLFTLFSLTDVNTSGRKRFSVTRGYYVLEIKKEYIVLNRVC